MFTTWGRRGSFITRSNERKTMSFCWQITCLWVCFYSMCKLPLRFFITNFFVAIDEFWDERNDDPFEYRFLVSFSIDAWALLFLKGGDKELLFVAVSLVKLCWWSRFERIEEFVPLVRDIHKSMNIVSLRFDYR